MNEQQTFIAGFLSEVAPFASMTTEQRARLVAGSSLVKFPMGETILTRKRCRKRFLWWSRVGRGCSLVVERGMSRKTWTCFSAEIVLAGQVWSAGCRVRL